MTPLALCALAALGGPADRAPLLVAACDSAECVRVLAVLWKVETASTFAVHPSTRYAFGPVQVLPVKGLTPTGAEMRDDPVVGLRAGWTVYLAKRARLHVLIGRRPSNESTFRAYNGHPKNKWFYSRHAARLLRAVEVRCEGG